MTDPATSLTPVSTATTEPLSKVNARCTITLPGLSVGEVVQVDPSRPYIADCLEAGYLVPVEAES